MHSISRRDFLKTLAAGGIAAGLPVLALDASRIHAAQTPAVGTRPVVGVARVTNGNTDAAVSHVLDLIGGVEQVCAGKNRILIKPNLVSPDPRDTTNPEVVRALVQLMRDAGKAVAIGEGSAMGPVNFKAGTIGNACRTQDAALLDQLQRHTFDVLGYSDLARSLKVPLINLHVGEMARVPLPDGFVFKEIMLHSALVQSDLICSVPMMKTHGLAGVTLGMKNMFGAFPGQVYGTVRSAVHARAAGIEPSGTASAVVDMVRACRTGLTVIDATVAMEGQGPTMGGGGILVRTDLIIAGVDPLATDMVAAAIMGFAPEEISTFTWAWQAGLSPLSLEEIDVQGEPVAAVRRLFTRPRIIPYGAIAGYGPPC